MLLLFGSMFLTAFLSEALRELIIMGSERSRDNYQVQHFLITGVDLSIIMHGTD